MDSQRVQIYCSPEEVEGIVARFQARCDANQFNAATPTFWLFQPGKYSDSRAIHWNEDAFDGITGAIRVPDHLPNAKALNSYLNTDRIEIRESSSFSRGYEYYVGFDRRRDIRDILPLICRSIRDGADSLGKLKWLDLDLPERVWMIAIADNLKGHLLGLFHAAAQQVRLALSSSRIHFADLTRFTAPLFQLAAYACDIYYSSLYGSDPAASIELLNGRLDELPRLVAWLSLVSRRDSYARSKLDNPLVIGSRIQERPDEYAGIDSICSLPTGGTQIAMAFATLASKCGRPLAHFPLFLPLRTMASSLTYREDEALNEYLSEYPLHDSSILIVDDSIRSGDTMASAIRMIQRSHPRRIEPLTACVDLEGMRNLAHEQAQVSIANPSNKYLSDARGGGRSSPTPLGVRRSAEGERAQRYVDSLTHPATRSCLDRDSRMTRADLLAQKVGVLLFKPDCVDLGISEWLVAHAQQELLADGIRLIGLDIVHVTRRLGSRLYAHMSLRKRNILVDSYLGLGPSVLAVFVGPETAKTTEKLLTLRGKGLYDLTIEELNAVPLGLQKGLRGIMPVPGTGDVYRPIVKQIIRQRMGKASRLDSDSFSVDVWKNLVHAPDGGLELLGLLSMLGSAPISLMFADSAANDLLLEALDLLKPLWHEDAGIQRAWGTGLSIQRRLASAFGDLTRRRQL